ncbi:MAG: GTP 3',8-cyclase MoaA [Halieaceae bacterium]|jgi:cyclic pyranopterin phosphate synthase|nr:GTP 3',8-cyclase MoaA [Halieaceae bacterium]
MTKLPTLVDRFGRSVDYVRLSVTDRCDFRCVYCMAEDMQFAPRAEILSLEELERVARSFVELGVKKIRLTGGEPLIRHNVMHLVEALGRMPGLEQLVMTTNGSRLDQFALPLKAAGVKRLNISIDSLRPDRFRQITRTGDLSRVLTGIDAAIDAGFERIKLNAVILKGRNEDEVLDLLEFALQRGLDLTFIEEMPLGLIDEHDRALTFCSSEALRALIGKHFSLQPTEFSTGGPSRYWRIPGQRSLVGFISPHSHNFCHLCNRVRVTVQGRLLLCLGNEHSADLRALMRDPQTDDAALRLAIIRAMDLKPEKHHFDLNEAPDIVRFMSATGG